ncbi:MAG: hypothetical protein EXR99_12265 [Gemmataceae bacterium]|nr:hypothetical protein [Gemmataceae bacterium]
MRKLLPLLLLVFLAASGCQSTHERTDAIQPLPESLPPPPYPELLSRARAQATFATEAFFVNNWEELATAAGSLEQTARQISRTGETPTIPRATVLTASSELNRDAGKLKEAALAKNETETNSILQRIHLRIRELRTGQE